MVSKIFIKFNRQKLFQQVCYKLVVSILLLSISFSASAMFRSQAYCPMDLYMMALMGGAQDNSNQLDSERELRDRLKKVERNIDALLETMDEVQENLEGTLGADGSILDQVLEFEASEWKQEDGDKAYCTQEELEALGVASEAEWGAGGSVSSLDSTDVYTLASVSKNPSFFQLSFLEVFTEKALFTLIPAAAAVCNDSGVFVNGHLQRRENGKFTRGSEKVGCYCGDSKMTRSRTAMCDRSW